jgi:hypothetical protein
MRGFYASETYKQSKVVEDSKHASDEKWRTKYQVLKGVASK